MNGVEKVQRLLLCQTQENNFRIIPRDIIVRISCALKSNKNLPPIPVDSTAEQVQWQTGILKLQV